MSATFEFGRDKTRSKLQQHSSVRCSQDPAHRCIRLCIGFSTGFHPTNHHQSAAATKHIPPPSFLLRKLWHHAAHHLIHSRRLAHRAPYLDRHPFIHSFSLPAHRIGPAVSAEIVCSPREPATERGSRCKASRERQPVLCVGGKEDVKQERMKRATTMEETKEKG